MFQRDYINVQKCYEAYFMEMCKAMVKGKKQNFYILLLIFFIVLIFNYLM